MKILFAIPIAFAACAMGIAQARADSFTVDEWFLSTGVTNYATGSASHAFIVVQNPFDANDPISFGSSTAFSSYDFAWGEQFGRFLIQSTQQAEGVPTYALFTSCDGGITITPSAELTLTIDASWTFNLPAWPTDTTLLAGVYGATSHVVLFYRTTGGQTQWPGGDAGTVGITGQVTLPVGETWVLRYGMNIYNESGNQALLATGSGYVDFEITPEPAAALPLALALGAMSRRRHRDVRAATRLS